MEKIKMQTTRPEDALLTDAFADFLEKCRAKNLSEKTLNIYTVHFKFFREYLSDPDKKASDITEDTLEGFTSVNVYRYIIGKHTPIRPLNIFILLDTF